MEITKGIEIVDLSLFIKKCKTLVISDVHLGIESELHYKGVLVPKYHFKELMKRFEYIFSKVKPEKIIILGDLKHEFGRISEQEWRELLRFFDYLSANSNKVILLKGNHDPFLGPIARKRNLELVAELQIGNTLFIHGDYEPKLKKNINLIIMGHEHPAITLREKTKIEKFKCFLRGKYKNKELIVVPSLNLLVEGNNVLDGEFISPLLKKQNFEVFVVEKNKVYAFGKMNKLN
ncbi:MAG: metallophosphoesterase [Nanoarchaeota archaeon]